MRAELSSEKGLILHLLVEIIFVRKKGDITLLLFPMEGNESIFK